MSPTAEIDRPTNLDKLLNFVTYYILFGWVLKAIFCEWDQLENQKNLADAKKTTQSAFIKKSISDKHTPN